MFQFLAYADIHHDEYNNGVSLADTIAVEDQITEYAQSHQIPLVIFAGDWFRATNPLQVVVKSAEAAWKRRSDAGIATTAIPGNHDRWTKSAYSGHAFAAAGVFREDLKKVSVFDKVTCIDIGGTDFLFVPAWHENMVMPPIGGRPVVVVFHGMVVDSKLPGGRGADGNIDVEVLKQFNSFLLLGGDNHMPQAINAIPNAFYLGAPLQHNWGDIGQERGFWHIKIDGGRAQVSMVPSKSPKFVRLSIPASNEVDAICKIGAELSKYQCPTIVEATLIGPEVGTINKDIIEKNMLGMGARKATVIIDRAFDKIEISPLVAQARTPEDKWSAYIVSGVAPGMEGLDPGLLNVIGLDALKRAKNAP